MIPGPLFQRGDFTLASGQRAHWKIECDALTPDDWAGLAAMLIDYLPHPFGSVRGVPRGGVPFEQALWWHATPGAKRVLVVDDVWTTGGSMQRFIDRTGLYHVPLMRAVAFARNPVPDGVTALLSVPR